MATLRDDITSAARSLEQLGQPVTSGTIAMAIGIATRTSGHRRVIRELHRMVEDGVAVREGEGRATRWRIA